LINFFNSVRLSYQILPNIIFIFSVLGILLIILRRLPEATAQQIEEAKEPEAHQKLIEKGLPAQAFSKVSVFLKLRIKQIWNFALEAKDLKPHAVAGYKMKKIFGGKLAGTKPEAVKPLTMQEVRNEQYYLDQIKIQPKNLVHYDALGKYYLDQDNLSDAKDIYQYLVNHQPQSPDFQARLAYCFYQSKDFSKAAEHYEKSIGLDSTQPNRYYNLGLSLESSGKHLEALKALNKAIEQEPENPKYKQALNKVKKALR
jgi:tetratricopeptide (TPR) repeat protein